VTSRRWSVTAPEGGERGARGYGSRALAVMTRPNSVAREQNSGVDQSDGVDRAADSRPPFVWPDGRAVERCLSILAEGQGLFSSSNPHLVAMMISPEFRDALHSLGSWPVLDVDCRRAHCRARLERWTLAPSDGIAGTYFVPKRMEDRLSAPVPATARAVAGKGARLPETSSLDAKGTYSLRCPKCGLVNALSPERRTKMYLEALRDHQFPVLV
jgi:hypothetical protein